MILINLFLHVRERETREMLEGKLQRIFGVWETNQSTPLTLSTALVYTNDLTCRNLVENHRINSWYGFFVSEVSSENDCDEQAEQN